MAWGFRRTPITRAFGRRYARRSVARRAFRAGMAKAFRIGNRRRYRRRRRY